MRNKTLIALALLVGIFGCTFEPEGRHFVPLDEEIQVKMKQLDLLHVQDTFQLFGRNTRIAYNIAPEDADTVYISIYVDGRFLEKKRSLLGSFILEADNYEDGFHTLRLEVITNSGTGSLSDQLGGELVKWSREWTFLLDSRQALPLEIKSVDAENGYLVIKWENTGPLTEKVITLRSSVSSLTPEWSYHITDPEQRMLLDSNFVGGDVKVLLQNISLRPTDDSPVTTYEGSFPSPAIRTAATDGYGNVKVSWNRPLFYQNLGRYEIYYDDQLIHSAGSVQDTIAVLDSIPLFYAYLRLRTVSANKVETKWGEEEATSTGKQILLGEKHPWFMDNLIHSSQNPALGFMVNSRAVSVLYHDSVTIMLPEMEVDAYIGLGISHDGSRLFLPQHNQLISLNRSGEKEIIYSPGELNGESFAPRLFATGEERYLCFVNKNGAASIFSPGYPATWVYVFDLTDRKIIHQMQVPPGIERVVKTLWSADGKYLVIQYPYQIDIHTMAGGQVQNTISLDKSPQAVFFSAKEENELILYNQHALLNYNVASGQERSFPLDTPSVLENLNYDPVTGLMGGEMSNSYYVVIDPQSGSILRYLPITGDTWFYNLYNGNLYARTNKLNLQLK